MGCRNAKHEHEWTHHRFLRHRTVTGLHNVISTHTSYIEPPRKLPIADPRHVGVTEPGLVLEPIRGELLPAELVCLLVCKGETVSHTCSSQFRVIRTCLRDDGCSLLVDPSAIAVQGGLGIIWDDEVVRRIIPNILVVERLCDALVNLGQVCTKYELTAH